MTGAVSFSDVFKDDPGVGDVHVSTALGNSRKPKKAKTFSEISVMKYDWEVPFNVAKSVEEKQFIFGWASIVEKNGRLIIDKQGDIILPDDLETGAYNFLLKGGVHGEMHTIVGTGKPIESMIFNASKIEALAKMGIIIPAGLTAWWTGFHVSDPATWALHKSGHLKEFSIGGKGRRITVDA